MTDTTEAPEGGPCPPVEDFGDDAPNALEALADFDAEEKDEETK